MECTDAPVTFISIVYSCVMMVGALPSIVMIVGLVITSIVIPYLLYVRTVRFF